MKAISLWQPWASLWGTTSKSYETRDWSTPYRGRIVVHAAKRLESDCGEELDEICIKHFGPHWRTQLPRGALIATGTISVVVPTDQLTALWAKSATHVQAKTGDFSPGRYAWQIADYNPLPTPIPYRGMQGLFDVPDNVLLR